ncbi:MAG: SCP-like extracellular [Sphingomonadales bacterium]|nr:SCP-like extracellular [Sphingomonadales bacterium]
MLTILLGASIALIIAFLPLLAEARDAAPASFDQRLLEAHNRERMRLNITPLQWSEQLAGQARDWADTLARRGGFEHSRDRSGAGENLWMGTASAYAPEDMIGAFVSEGRQFHSGRFPAISRTGNWVDVGHYSQLIWPATREVGCAIAEAHGNEVLVCRYWPAGNVWGQQVP